MAREDVVAFAREVAGLVADTTRRRELGRLGSERALATFSWQTFDAGLSQVMSKV